MSTFDVNDPYTTGAPGRVSWTSAIPNKASAFCCTSAEASVAGVIAPIRVNGVTDTGWPNSAIVMSPSAMASSMSRGLLTLTTVSTPGLSANSSSDSPLEIAIFSIPSRARPRPIAVQ